MSTFYTILGIYCGIALLIVIVELIMNWRYYDFTNFVLCLAISPILAPLLVLRYYCEFMDKHMRL